MLLRDLQEQIADLLRIGPVGRAHGHDHAPERIAQHPVRDLSLDQFGVRHDHVGPIERLDLGRADTDALDIAFGRTDHDPVIGLDRPLEQQDQAGHEIVEYILQAESDADGERTGDDRQIGELHASHREADDQREGHTEITGNRDDGFARAALHARTAEPALIQALLEPAGNPDADNQRDQPPDQANRHDLEFAERNALVEHPHDECETGIGEPPHQQGEQHEGAPEHDCQQGAQPGQPGHVLVGAHAQ